MNIIALLSKLRGVRECGPGQWMAICPAHDDKTPSLAIAEGKNGGIVLHCHAGCTVAAIVAALGMKTADLMPTRRKRLTPNELPDSGLTIEELARAKSQP